MIRAQPLINLTPVTRSHILSINYYTAMKIQYSRQNQPKSHRPTFLFFAARRDCEQGTRYLTWYTSHITATMTSSRVRVAVRVRPLGHQEVAQGGTHVVTARHPEIRLGERRFTFDSVFDTSVSQAALFEEVSGPLQTSFLDGYNATVSSL